MAIQTLLHVDLAVASMERALHFYRDGLGINLLEDTIVEGDVPMFLSSGRFSRMRLVILQPSRIGGGVELIEFESDVTHESAKAEETRGGLQSISFLVDDIPSTVSRLATFGIQPLSEIMEVDLPALGKSNIVYFEDPDGHQIELVALQ